MSEGRAPLRARQFFGAAGGLGGFFPPLVLGVVRDGTGGYTMGFVFLVGFAWMCAGQALASPGAQQVAPR